MRNDEGKATGIGKAVLLCVIFYLIFVVTEFAFPRISEGLALEFDYPTKFFLQLLVSWPIAIWAGLRLTGQTFRSFLPIRPFSARLLFPVFLFLFGLTVLLIQIIGWIPMSEELRKHLDQNFSANPAMMIASGVLIAPIAEEIFFRGIIFKGFLGRYSLRMSVIASAALFGVFHLNPWQFLLAVPMGIVSSVLFFRTGSILVAVYCHFVINGVSGVVLPIALQVAGYPAREIESLARIPIGLVLLAAFLLVAGWKLLKRQGVDFRLQGESVAESL